MWGWIDRLGVLVLDASLGATLLVASIALAMVGCRQPSRRVGLARAAILGSLALIPLVALSPLPASTPSARSEVSASTRTRSSPPRPGPHRRRVPRGAWSWFSPSAPRPGC